jgi:hypothetical protein
MRLDVISTRKYEHGTQIQPETREEGVSLKMKVDNEFLEQLANNPGRIDKLSEEERREILEFLRRETESRIEEERKGNGLFDQIKRYTDTLSEEDRKQFYLDWNKRWARIAKEESKRLNKIWKQSRR